MKNEDMIVKMQEQFNEGLEKVAAAQKEATEIFENGTSITYGLYNAQDKGELFIGAGVEVYEGMIVGICNREEDLAVNITRAKQMTNQRSSTKDSTVVLKAPRQLSLENYLEFIDDDELVEITPHHIRLRKVILDTVERKKYDARNK